jgi:ligand-binding sensor domain-containing protein
MKQFCLFPHIGALLVMLAVIPACSAQPNSNPGSMAMPETDAPIDEYVVALFEDSKGNLWFGTMSSGVARYTPSTLLRAGEKTLTYFSEKEGLPGTTVVSMAEDKAGNMWFGTHSGLSKYDPSAKLRPGGKTFTNFTQKDGLCHDRVSNILIDRAGHLWVGTWGGVCRYENGRFSDFPIPKPDVDLLPYQTTMDWVTEVMEDSQGNIWFGRDGYGACKYDGTSFTHFTKKEGLPSNNVQVIEEDQQGHIWFGTRAAENDHPDPEKRTGEGGLCRYDPSEPLRDKAFVQFPEWEGLSKNQIYTIYTDKKGHIWVGATGFGVYRYDGKSFHLYKGTNRMDLTYSFGVQDMLEDRNGTYWFGFSGGLFRLEGASIVHVSQNGPWK